MCGDFVFVRFHLLTFHFNEFQICRTQPSSISRQTVEGSLGFAQTIKTSKIDRWFGLIGNQGCNRTKGTSCIAMEPHFGCNPDRFDCERNAMFICQVMGQLNKRNQSRCKISLWIKLTFFQEFFWGGSIVMLFFYCFRTKFQGESLRGEQTAQREEKP